MLGVYSQCFSASGFSQIACAQVSVSRLNEIAPASSFQCSTLPPGCMIS